MSTEARDTLTALEAQIAALTAQRDEVEATLREARAGHHVARCRAWTEARDEWLDADRARRPLADGEHELIAEIRDSWGQQPRAVYRELVTVERRRRSWAVRVVYAAASQGRPPRAAETEVCCMRSYHRPQAWADLVEAVARGER